MKIISWITTLLVPLVLTLTAVRIVLSPWFIQFEYRTPAFPDDPFGFTFAERIEYANIAREYLLNEADISFLGELRFPEGEQAPTLSCQYMEDCTRLYNQRELEHMLDVKIVLKSVLNIWIVSLLLLLFIGVWAIYRKGVWGNLYLVSVVRGGWLTGIIIGVILIFVLVGFGIAFVAFHEIFFDPGTWKFLYSDTLIRLFPERFWRDTFLVVGVLAAGMGAILGYLLPRVFTTKNQGDQSADN